MRITVWGISPVFPGLMLMSPVESASAASDKKDAGDSGKINGKGKVEIEIETLAKHKLQLYAA